MHVSGGRLRRLMLSVSAKRMKLSPFITSAKAAILVCFGFFVVFPLLLVVCWWIQDWRYTRFSWRGQGYYARVAAACDQALAARESLSRQIRGKGLESLP